MKEMCVRNKKSKLSLYSIIGLGTLAVIVALGSAAYAALDNTDNKDKPLSGQMVLIDPFTLTTITPVTETSSSTVILSSDILQPQIWIPSSRPSKRSPYQPPWVPGPPPWHPGPPPWPPGPPPWHPGPPQ